MKIHPRDFRVTPGENVKLRRCATRTKPFYRSDEDYKERLREDVRKLSALQHRLYASNTYSVLLVFQAMDAAGKDGAISHVLTGINPLGCEVYSFKQPSLEESEHDFLWRTTCRLPARGRIGVFNRSYYEEVLVVRVHPEILEGQHLPPELLDRKAVWKGRYHSIVNFEKHLHRNGTQVIKFYLHLSKEEQRRRLLGRIDDPEKNWKFGAADLKERTFWRQYMDAYEKCLNATSTKVAPWYIVPADDKLNARLICSQIVIKVLEGLKTSAPKQTDTQRVMLRSMRRRLTRSA